MNSPPSLRLRLTICLLTAIQAAATTYYAFHNFTSRYSLGVLESAAIALTVIAAGLATFICSLLARRAYGRRTAFALLTLTSLATAAAVFVLLAATSFRVH